MAKSETYALARDNKGVMWDLLLYVPTVIFLFSIGLKLWYGPNKSWSYLLFFMASFFFIAGANRILSSRLMLMPSSPRSLEVAKEAVTVGLTSGSKVQLVKDLRYFPDYAGKSFGLTGMDLSGQKRQFVFHKGQFSDEGVFRDLRSLLAVYK